MYIEQNFDRGSIFGNKPDVDPLRNIDFFTSIVHESVVNTNIGCNWRIYMIKMEGHMV